MYVLTNSAGFVGNIIDDMTHIPLTGHLSCFERCLDTDICRAVSIGPLGPHTYCFYHTSDCLTEGVAGFTFMWRYCLGGKQFYFNFFIRLIAGLNISR